MPPIRAHAAFIEFQQSFIYAATNFYEPPYIDLNTFPHSMLIFHLIAYWMRYDLRT